MEARSLEAKGEISMKLYYAPRSRATRARWMLEEIGAPYELARIDLSKGEQKKADYLKIHPHGVVPALSDGDVTIFESAAICAYLADKFPESRDRKSTRLNSSHGSISYAVFCL